MGLSTKLQKAQGGDASSAPVAASGRATAPGDATALATGAATGVVTATTEAIQQRLLKLVNENGLHAFYDANLVRIIAGKLSSLDHVALSSKWKLPVELVYDLYALALYDVCFYCDDSGSMVFEEDGERVRDLSFILSRVAEIASVFDDDGVSVRFMNSAAGGDFIKTSAEVGSLLAAVPFGGMTPLGTNLHRKVLGPFVLEKIPHGALRKPLLVIVITDGEPSGEPRDCLLDVIRHAVLSAASAGYGYSAVAVEVAQVGRDVRTQRFLAGLDNDAELGGNIDCTSYFELEEAEFSAKGVTLTPELWLVKVCLGAIDRSYDEKD
jgi:hypothetical protein